MKLNTRLIGEVKYEEKDIITFPNGLPSFENEHTFLLLPLEGTDDSLYCLQSTVTPALAFIVMNPFTLEPGYAPHLSAGERKALGVDKDQDLCFYVLCALKRPVSNSTVNMRCPIALNPDEQIAMQVILDDEQYHMRHPLSQFSQKEGDAPC